MAKLPIRQKVTLLLFRRANPDEILLVPLEAKRAVRWVVPFTEAVDGESAGEAARQLAEGYVGAEQLAALDLGMPATYRVKAGPSAGEWTERFHAIEVAADAPAADGRWVPHYEAKAQSELPRVRDAITRLREMARLKP